MNKKTKKIMTTALAFIMSFALVIGAIEIVGTLGGPTATVQVLGSDGGYVPPSPSSSSSASSSGSTAKKKAKKKAAPKKKLSVSGKEVKVDYAAIQAGNVTLTKGDIVTLKNAGGKKTFMLKKVSGGAKKFFKISKKGKLTVKKGLAPGTYTVKIKVTTKGNKKCKAGSKTAKVTVVVPAPTPVQPTPAPPAPTPSEPASDTPGESIGN